MNKRFEVVIGYYKRYNQLRMIVSSSAISFRGNENQYFLGLENPTDFALAFKLKITNNALFSIAPGKGISAPHQKVQVSVKLNRLVEINAKLQVCYAQLREEEQEEGRSIDQLWAKIDRERHQSIFIPITRAASKQQQEKKEERGIFKKTDSPIYEMELKGEEKQDSNDNYSKRVQPIINKSLTLKHSTSMFRSIQDLDKREGNFGRGEAQRLEREFEQEREKNRRMTERLIEREKKIMYLTDMRQLEINRSLNRAEDEEIWTCCNVVLGAFLFMLLGFLLSKYELPPDVAKKWL